MIIGHYLGCGWNVEQIFEHLQQFPEGIGSRYLGDDRLQSEIARSAGRRSAASYWVSITSAKAWKRAPAAPPARNPLPISF
jgi:hypothetical protein